MINGSTPRKRIRFLNCAIAQSAHLSSFGGQIRQRDEADGIGEFVCRSRNMAMEFPGLTVDDKHEADVLIALEVELS